MAVAGSSRFVGRASELARLLAALHRAEQGQPTMVLVAGDAGMGKTRLLVEVADRARQRGVRVLAGGCVELGDIGLAYLPVVDALGGLADDPDEAALVAEVASISPAIARLLPGVVEPGPTGAQLDEGLEQLQVFDAVRGLLVRRSRRSPLLLLLEDLHWADRATGDLIGFLVRTRRSGRVLLVASYRSDELHRRHPLRLLLAELVRLPQVERLKLAPFSQAELAEHLEAIAGVRLPAERMAQIHSRSEGNPFYAEQLLAAGAGEAEVGLPTTLADALLARVHALAEPAQQVLRAAAVAGRRVPHLMLTQVTGWPEPDLELGLREAIGAGLLVADSSTGSYTFRHALVQEAVYDDLLPSEQVRLHAAYAQLLAADQQGVAAELAYHCLQSHDLAGALGASLAAARGAEAVLAPAETLRHLSTALKLWERVADPAQAARAYERLGQYLARAYHVEEALRAHARAVELVPAEPPTPLAARVTAAMAQALMLTGRRDQARRWCDQALTAARGAGNADEEADALITLGVIEAFEDPASARPRFAAARARAAEVGNREIELRALHDLAWVESLLGNLPAARAVSDEGAELAQQAGLAWSPLGMAFRCGQRSVRYVAGAWDECERLAATGPELVTTVPEGRLAAAELVVPIARGRTAAGTRLGQLVDLAGADRYLDMDVAVLEAELATWQGDLARANSAVQRALAAVEAIEHVSQVSHLTWVCMKGLTVQAERAERARATGNATVLADAIAVGGALLERMRAAVAQADRAGLAHDMYLQGWHAKAEAEWTRLQGRSEPAPWQAAVEAFTFGHVYAVARCRWRLAEALLAAGKREEATAAAHAAHNTAVALEAAPLRTALEALARRGRLGLSTGVATERTLAGLTPRELEVLQLLMAGKSNRQIAEQLFISGKTASVHVTNILAKLGVHSRLEAAARARELGLDRPADPSRR